MYLYIHHRLLQKTKKKQFLAKHAWRKKNLIEEKDMYVLSYYIPFYHMQREYIYISFCHIPYLSQAATESKEDAASRKVFLAEKNLIEEKDMYLHIFVNLKKI